MNLHLLSPYANGRIDPIARKMWLDHLPLTDADTADAGIMAILNWSNFTFNPDLEKWRKPWIMLDACEFGSYWDHEQLDWTFASPHGPLDQACLNVMHENPDWRRFLDWVRVNPPRLTFQRELPRRCVTPVRQPLDWTAQHPVQKPVSREEFLARPLEVFYTWGLSHRMRPWFHATIYLHSYREGYLVMPHWSHDRQLGGKHKVWAAWHIPAYLRQPMEFILDWQGKAKISVSLPGAGVKCFRHAEACINAVMALTDDCLAWSYPWEHLKNCVRLKRLDPYGSLLEASRRDLYDVYVAGLETARKYEAAAYAKDYLMKQLTTLP